MATSDELERKLDELREDIERGNQYNPVKHKDETRSKIALFVVRTYFILVGIILVGIPLYNVRVRPELVLSVPDLLSTLSGILSGLVGFVVGYYFKAEEKEFPN